MFMSIGVSKCCDMQSMFATCGRRREHVLHSEPGATITARHTYGDERVVGEVHLSVNVRWNGGLTWGVFRGGIRTSIVMALPPSMIAAFGRTQ